jgi:hypothetical protein
VVGFEIPAFYTACPLALFRAVAEWGVERLPFQGIAGKGRMGVSVGKHGELMNNCSESGCSNEGRQADIAWADEIAEGARSLAISASFKHKGWDKCGGTFELNEFF